MRKTINDIINVNITTWKGRDMYLPLMLSHLLKSQTLLPDNVYIWLSIVQHQIIY